VICRPGSGQSGPFGGHRAVYGTPPPVVPSPARPMDFRILGPLEVYDRGQALALGGAKQRALLALLLLHANEAVSRDRLIDELWSTPPETASAAIQVYVSQLRKLLGRDAIVTQPPGYLIRVQEGTVDLERFEESV